MRGKRAPQRDRQVAISRDVKGKRETRTVVVIDSGLAAGCGVQIDNDAETGIAAPLHQTIEQCPPWPFEAIVTGLAWSNKQPPMQRHPHRIETCRLDETDIIFADIGV